ncbi:MAG: DEAD/DEAH box helicase [Patescibacteria group bacterium]|nr:DEAD/DEAH box helicase [Patescibacteria group bacterium]
MSFGESSHRMFEPKSLEELETQVKDSESFWEQSLIPSEYREDTEEIMKMSVEEIKEKYPARYKIYLQSLRELKSVEKNHDGKMTLKEFDAFRLRLRMMNNLNEYVHKISNGDKETHLREHQVSTFEKLRDFLESGGSSGYIELPTGTGKTVVFIEFLRILDVPSIVVVPTKNLVEQTLARLEQFAKNLKVGAVYSKAKDYGSKVLVTTYDSLPNLIDNEKFDLDDLGLVILDEAHESLSKKRSEVVEKLKEASIVIGLTATSEYSDTKNVENLLGEKIHEMSLREAIESGALSACSAMVATTKVDISNVIIKSNGEYDEKELSKAINIEARNKAVTEMATNTFAGKQKILFCGSVDHCRELADRINKAGEVAEVVVGETQDKVEEKYINLGFKGGWKEAYKKGVIKAVLSVDLITRGTDLPSAEVCMNVSPTASLVRATQRGGRVTRLDPNNPNKHAIVVDFVDLGEDGKHFGNFKLFYEILGDTVVVPKSSGSSVIEGLMGDERTIINKEKEEKGFFEKPVIEGLEVVIDLDEMERLVHRKTETVEEKQKIYIDLIKKGFTPEKWLSLTSLERGNVRILDFTLIKVARIFGMSGNPVGYYDVQIELGRKIYGDDAINEALKELDRKNSPEYFSNIIKAKYSAFDWVNMKAPDKKEFSVDDKGLVAISRIFGVSHDPVNNNEVYLVLGRKIYGDDAINEALKELDRKNSPEYFSNIIKAKYSAFDWINMKTPDKKEFSVDDKGLVAISRIFGVSHDPVGNHEVHLVLGRKIYGDEDIDKELEKPVKIYSKIIKEKYSAQEWVNMSSYDRKNLVIEGRSSFAVYNIFLSGNSSRGLKAHLAAGRKIYGNDVIDDILSKNKKRVIIRSA